ncbi:MAG: hypothetical protein JXR91_16185, partial [Deltaproteobacteria bacterium]|nr:hypothetical protein [Deltaproteobacteria bacterium]
RTSDIIFMFKNTIMIMLPHTDQNSLNLLIKRMHDIINIAFSDNSPVLQENILPFPNPSITKASQVYDWSEDQLR